MIIFAFVFFLKGLFFFSRLRDEVYHGSPVMVGDCDACDAFGLPTVDQFTPVRVGLAKLVDLN